MRALAIIATALLLSGCATALTNIEAAYSTLTSATVSAQAVTVAVDAFDAAEVTATNVVRLRKCTGSNGPICRSVGAAAEIAKAVRAGRVARNNLEQFLSDHPGALGPQGLYDALTTATTTLTTILAKYKTS